MCCEIRLDAVLMSTVLYSYPGAENASAYELLNRCTDPDQKIEACLHAIAPWDGRTVLDVGAGSGFHTVRFAATAQRVWALEPDERLVQQMEQRLARQPAGNIAVLQGGAAAIPLPYASVDWVHARFAYFFGTDASLPGLAEVRRVLRPGGDLFVIDVNPGVGEYARIVRRAYPDIFHANYQRDHEAFFARHGFRCHAVATVFRAPDRAALEAVFRMDFPHCWRELADSVTTLELTYGISVYHWRED